MSEKNENKTSASNFIELIIEDDLKSNKYNGNIVTRFPPEPNGYLHIGHAKAICIDFGIAEKYNGKCHMRFDDTNPVKEEDEFVQSILEDVKWLGFDWDEHLYYASDYFEKIYEYAVQLIKKGAAYVDDLSGEEIREYRGTLTKPGKESPYRNRSVEENLNLFEKMRAGEFADGEKVLRAKIDMASQNMNLRDPVMYRILHAEHHRAGNKWCIYPMYDWAHGLEDSIEGVTYSLCSLEFENHRPLYDWFLDQLEIHHPRQIEFARLNITNTILAKRKLSALVEKKLVNGWDDPRMPTIAGIRRRGYTPEALKDFLERVGVAKTDSTVDVALLEHCLRENLNKSAKRVMAVLKPLKLIIDNYPEEQIEMLEAENNPEDPTSGKREIPFSRELYIEQTDFMEEPPKKFFRLAIGREVRLKHAYYVTCQSVVKNEKTGEIVEVHCSYDPATKGGWSDDGRKVKGTLHWVSAEKAVNAEVRLYDHLFTADNPAAAENLEDILNPDSLEVLTECKVEPGLLEANPGDRFQFLRHGYFCVDNDSSDEKLVFNRTVSMRDSWAKIQKQMQNRGKKS